MSKISKPYKKATIAHVTQGYHKNHTAIDMSFKGGHGTFLVAPEDGTIIKIVNADEIDGSVEDLKRGWGIRIRSTDKTRHHTYWHCMPVFPVDVGQKVKQGQIIAQMGNSGNVRSRGTYVPLLERNKPPYRGTHLHWSMLENQIAVDALRYIDWTIPIKYSFWTRFNIIMILFKKIKSILATK